MATGALSAFGTLLKLGDGATNEAFTTIAEVRDISGPSLAMDAVEVTSHSSTSAYREFIGGLLDGGEVTFDVNFLPANATHSYSAGLIKDLHGRTKRNFQIIWPGTTTWSFAAFVTKFEPSAAVDGALSASVTLKITGVPSMA